MITDRHVAFARAMVALAREHGMNNLHLTFDSSASQNFDSTEAGLYSHAQIEMRWREGRHGDNADIAMQCAAHRVVPEKEPDAQLP